MANELLEAILALNPHEARFGVNVYEEIGYICCKYCKASVQCSDWDGHQLVGESWDATKLVHEPECPIIRLRSLLYINVEISMDTTKCESALNKVIKACDCAKQRMKRIGMQPGVAISTKEARQIALRAQRVAEEERLAVADEEASKGIVY